MKFRKGKFLVFGHIIRKGTLECLVVTSKIVGNRSHVGEKERCSQTNS